MVRFEDDRNEGGYCALLSSDDAALVDRFQAWLRQRHIPFETVTSARGDAVPDVMTVRFRDEAVARELRMTWAGEARG